MTSKQEDVFKPITFRPNKELAETLKTYMGIHKISTKTEAIHGIAAEWKILTEQQNLGLISKPLTEQEIQAFQWEEIDCSFLFVEGKLGFCSNRNPPIRLPLKFTPQVCRHCQSVSINQAHEDNILKALNLSVSGKRRSQVAQALIGLQTQYNASKDRISEMEGTLGNWKRNYDEVSSENRALKSREREVIKREEALKGREEELTRIDRDYSEKRGALENLNLLKVERDSLKDKLETQESQWKSTVEEKERRTIELQSKSEAQEKRIVDLTKEAEALKESIKNIPTVYRVLCPEKGSVELKFCLKDCQKFIDCSLALTNRDLSERKS